MLAVLAVALNTASFIELRFTTGVRSRTFSSVLGSVPTSAARTYNIARARDCALLLPPETFQFPVFTFSDRRGRSSHSRDNFIFISLTKRR